MNYRNKMLANYQNIVSTYQSVVSELIDNLGKLHLIQFSETIQGTVDPNFYDIVRQQSDSLRPDYKQTIAHPSPSTIMNGMLIRGFIKYQPKDYQNFDVRLNSPNNSIRIKSYLEDARAINAAKFIIPNVQVSPVINPFLSIPLSQPSNNPVMSGFDYKLWNNNSFPACYIFQPTADKYRLVKACQPRGMGSDEFLYSFWEQIQ